MHAHIGKFLWLKPINYVTGDKLDSEEEEINIMEIIHQNPTCYEDAMKEAKWKKAMDSEMEMIEKNQTW